jgi:hypothetical protein
MRTNNFPTVRFTHFYEIQRKRVNLGNVISTVRMDMQKYIFILKKMAIKTCSVIRLSKNAFEESVFNSIGEDMLFFGALSAGCLCV